MPSLKALVKQFDIKPNPDGVKKLVTEPFRSSYAFVHEPRAQNEGDEPKYSIQMIFDKTDAKALKPLIQIIANAAAAKWGDVSKWPRMKYNPMTSDLEHGEDGDMSSVEKHLLGKMTLNARNKNKPGIVGPDAKPLFDADDFYSGCTARAALGCFAYDNSGNKGVSFALNNLMKVGDADRLDGQSKAEDDFSSFAVETTEGSEADSTEGF